MPETREIDCRLDGDTVHIQIGEECREFTRDEADWLYNRIAESFFESDQEVVLAGMRMTGDEAYRLCDLMCLEAAELGLDQGPA